MSNTTTDTKPGTITPVAIAGTKPGKLTPEPGLLRRIGRGAKRGAKATGRTAKRGGFGIGRAVKYVALSGPVQAGATATLVVAGAVIGGKAATAATTPKK